MVSSNRLGNSTQQKTTIMTKLTLILSAALLISGLAFSQTNCDVKENYGDFVRVQKLTNKGRSYLSKSLIDPKTSKCFEKLLRNSNYISYLLFNFSSTTYDEALLRSADSIARQKEFVQFLKDDTLFNRVITELICKTIDNCKPKDTVTMDKLLNVAVKFFSIPKINDQGYFVGKVCVGINGLETTEKIRKPQLEAFCYSSIFSNFGGTEFNMYEEFVEALKELYKVNLGIDNKEKLLRAQGAMFFLMRNNEKLRLMLKSEYEKNKDNLPFILEEK